MPSPDPDPQAGSLLLEALGTGMSLAHWAARQPNALAVIARESSVSFADLNARSNQLARGLRARGVAAGGSVALLSGNRLEFVEVVMATRRIGQRLTPVNFHLTGDEAGYIVGDCDAEVLFAEARLGEVALRAANMAPKARVRVAIGGTLDGFVPYEDLLRAQSGSDIDDPVVGT